MSFARFALRVAAVRAIKAAGTLVGDNVRDSDFSAIDIGADGDLRTAEDRPFVLVYTDDSTSPAPAQRDLRQNGELDLVIEFGIAGPMTQTDPVTGESTIVGIGIAGTDEAFELALDMIDRQVTVALTADTPWAEIWRRLSTEATKIERRRAASTEGGVRHAFRQMRVSLLTLPDPVWGQPLVAGAVWTDFVAALTAEDATLGAVASGFLGPQGADLTFDMIRASRGYTQPEATALRQVPLHPGGEGWTVDQTQVDETIAPAG